MLMRLSSVRITLPAIVNFKNAPRRLSREHKANCAFCFGFFAGFAAAELVALAAQQYIPSTGIPYPFESLLNSLSAQHTC